MPILLILVGAAWWFFGDPARDVAKWFWPEEAAPWETVDGYYYPDRTDLTRHVAHTGFSSVDDCRAWIYAEAERQKDAGLARGDYECGVGKMRSEYGLNVYRATVR